MNVINKKVLEKAKYLWGIRRIEFVRKMANYIYYCPKDKVYLRVTEDSHRSKNQIESELHWMSFLSGEGIELAYPIRSKSNNLVESVSILSETFHIACFKEAFGKRIRMESEFSERLLINWGGIIASLHIATKKYDVPQNIELRPDWKTDGYHKNIIDFRSESDGKIFDESKRLENLFENLDKSSENYGLIHADLHTGNFNVNYDESLTLFDFDDCVYHWFLYDIATIFWSLVKLNLNEEKYSKLFLQGYLEINNIPNYSKQLLEEFYRYRMILIYYYAVSKIESNNLSNDIYEKLQTHIIDTYSFFNIERKYWRIKPQ